MRNNNNYNNRLINDNETSFSIKNLFIILIIILVVLVGFYFITKYVLENKTENRNVQESIIQKDKIIFGQLFSRSESEYYAIAYYDNSKAKSLYDKYIAEYKKKDNHLKVYEINLNESFNKNFISKNENIVNNIEDFKVADETLLKIKEGKVEIHKTGSNEINAYLKEISK